MIKNNVMNVFFIIFCPPLHFEKLWVKLQQPEIVGNPNKYSILKNIYSSATHFQLWGVWGGFLQVQPMSSHPSAQKWDQVLDFNSDQSTCQFSAIFDPLSENGMSVVQLQTKWSRQTAMPGMERTNQTLRFHHKCPQNFVDVLLKSEQDNFGIALTPYKGETQLKSQVNKFVDAIHHAAPSSCRLLRLFGPMQFCEKCQFWYSCETTSSYRKKNPKNVSLFSFSNFIFIIPICVILWSMEAQLDKKVHLPVGPEP